jgi:hypothetical protein
MPAAVVAGPRFGTIGPSRGRGALPRRPLFELERGPSHARPGTSGVPRRAAAHIKGAHLFPPESAAAIAGPWRRPGYVGNLPRGRCITRVHHRFTLPHGSADLPHGRSEGDRRRPRLLYQLDQVGGFERVERGAELVDRHGDGAGHGRDRRCVAIEDPEGEEHVSRCRIVHWGRPLLGPRSGAPVHVRVHRLFSGYPG